ncbi:hypothetical protein GCM10027570_15260 [Streptomonospora sediminis]
MACARGRNTGTPGTGGTAAPCRARPRSRRTAPAGARTAAALTAAGAVLAGCGVLPPLGGRPPADGSAAPSPEPAPSSAPGARPPTGEQVERAETLLTRAEVAPEESGADYERAEFGESWADTDGNGCPTRHDILARDLRSTRTAADCTVTRGVLEDPYTGERIEFSAAEPMRVQVDHVVPLALAWRTGAAQWDTDRRVDFANDPANLLATDGPANQSKGDSGPGRWRPYPAFRCTYAIAYVGVVDRYGLWLPATDRAALAGMLGTC